MLGVVLRVEPAGVASMKALPKRKGNLPIEVMLNLLDEPQ